MQTRTQTSTVEIGTAFQTRILMHGVARFRMWVIACLLAAGIAQGAATNRYVATVSPSSGWPYDSWANAATNIKDAVDSANMNDAGDTVYISNGTYYVTQAILVSNVVVKGYSGDRTGVIVNGNYPTVTSRCFILTHPNAVVSSLTIANGHATTTDQFPELKGSGGGIYASGGRIENCVITGCHADVSANQQSGGGGICARNVTIDGCSIVDNRVDGEGALYSLSGGGGVYLQPGCLTNCFVGRNSAVCAGGMAGGGVCAMEATKIYGCTIVSNTASAWGGGVFFRTWGWDGACIFNSTVASNAPHGIFESGEICPSLRNCLIANNADHGVFVYYGQPPASIDSCTFVSNGKSGLDYASNCDGQGKTNIVSNCIFYYNGAVDVCDETGGGLTTSIWYSCVAPGAGFDIEGVVTNEPAFVDRTGDNYRLRRDSLCHNAGTNMAWMVGSSDLDGNARIVERRVDMGCYELPPVRGTVICFK